MLFSSRISASCCTAARRATRGDRLKAFGSSPMVDAMAYSVRLAHLDGHLNMQLHPMVLPILGELAALTRARVREAVRAGGWCSSQLRGRRCRGAPRLRLTRVPSSQSASSAGHHGNRELPCTSCNARPNAALGGRRGGAEKLLT